jgi:hypothetical protein
MTETFRLPRRGQWQVLGCTLLFLAATIGSASPLFLKDPARHGFNRPHSAAITAALGISVFGARSLLCVYLLAAYQIELVSLADDAIVIRSTFQNRRFGPGDVDELRWRIAPAAGRVALLCGGRKTVLDLGGFRPADRLQMIRRLHKMLSEERQTGWPLFCHLIALPLRDGISPKQRVHPAAPEFRPDSFVFVTRRRYDLQLAGALPVSLAFATVYWWRAQSAAMFALPPFVMLYWALLRSSVAPEGQRHARLTRPGIGRPILVAIVSLLASLPCVFLLPLFGLSWNMAALIGGMLCTPSFLLLFRWAIRDGNQQTRDNLIGAASAPACWESAEL